MDLERERYLRDLTHQVPGGKQGILDRAEGIGEKAGLSPTERQVLNTVVVGFLEGDWEASLTGEALRPKVFRPGDRGNPGRTAVLGIRRKLEEFYKHGGSGCANPFCIRLPENRTLPILNQRTRLFIPTIMYRKYLEPFSDKVDNLVRNARAAMNLRTRTGFSTALQILNDISEVDGYRDHPRVLAIQAEVHVRRAMYGSWPEPELRIADDLVSYSFRQTLGTAARDSPFWETHLADAMVRCFLDWNWPGAEDAWAKATSLPGGEEALYHTWHLSFLLARGKKERVLKLLKEKERKSGLIPVEISNIGLFYLLAGEQRKAVATLSDALKNNPHPYITQLHLALALERDDPQAALRLVREIRWTPSELGVTWGVKAFLQGRCGQRVKAWLGFRRLVLLRSCSLVLLQCTKRLKDKGLLKRRPHECVPYIPATQVMLAAIGAGRLEEAVRYFRDAKCDHDVFMDWILTAPWLRDIQGMKSLRELAVEIGLKAED
jgi:hypothetical protein